MTENSFDIVEPTNYISLFQKSQFIQLKNIENSVKKDDDNNSSTKNNNKTNSRIANIQYNLDYIVISIKYSNKMQ